MIKLSNYFQSGFSVLSALGLSALLLSTLLLSGCDYSSNSSQKTLLKTQAKAKAELVASEYQVEVTFKAEAETQLLASAELASKLKGFEAWAAEHAFVMTGGAANLSGIYQYNPNEKRKLIAYEALQRFNLTELNFDEYQKVMAGVPKYGPFNLQLINVVASEQDKSKTKRELINKAFSMAKDKAVAMSKAAGLCDVSVSEMSEHVQDHASPRMMKMSMEADSLHSSESKQTITLNLNVSWLANPC